MWDIANSIRWLKQKFKDFKIEKFLFGEIYANYFLNASDFILSLMEELGYDKEDNGNESNGSSSSSAESSPANSPTKKSPQKAAHFSQQQQKQLNISSESLKQKNSNKPFISSSSAKFLSQLSNSNSQTTNQNRDDSNSNCSYTFTGGVNSLFEDETTDRHVAYNDLDSNDLDDTSYLHQSQNLNYKDTDNILNEFIKKKP